MIDTPEVAKAKAAHFAAFNAVAARAPESVPIQTDNADSSEEMPFDGEAEDEDNSNSAEGYYDATNVVTYRGPPAPLAKDGRVVDTPEVARAKAAHLAAIEKAAKGKQLPQYSPFRYF